MNSQEIFDVCFSGSVDRRMAAKRGAGPLLDKQTGKYY